MGAPCWIDLLTSDPGAATRFYADVFGWTAGEGSPGFGGYLMFFADGVPVAGCMRNEAGTGYPDAWGTYLSTADVKATADAALARGGTLRAGPLDIADLGSQAVLTDPSGARIGAWQAKAFGGFAPEPGGPGTPAYFELLTRDYERAVGFYKEVFGWGAQMLSDTPQFKLTGLTDGKETLAGIMDASGFLPADQGDHWAVYLRVADADVALSLITRLGGTVTQEPQDTPYGRIAGVADPTGARFKIVGLRHPLTYVTRRAELFTDRA